MDKSQLVVLEYCQNPCYTEVVDLQLCKYEVTVNLEKCLWSYKDFKDIPIGKRRYLPNIRPTEPGVIGVYDRLDTNQLNRMMRDSIEANDGPHSTDFL